MARAVHSYEREVRNRGIQRQHFRVMDAVGRARDPEAIFFVNYEGKILDSPAVHYHMKSFLEETENGHLPSGCNPVS